MSARCDLFIEEHTAGAPCEDKEHQAALERRRGGAAEWGAIKRGSDAGGERDFLDGRAIHCGATLELQSIEYKGDDYGEFVLRLAKGVRVRYELDVDRRVVLYADVGGYLFAEKANPWMRFRWPEERR